MAKADLINVTKTRVQIQNPTAEPGEEYTISTYTRANPARVVLNEAPSDIKAGDTVELINMGDEASGHYVVVGVDGTTVKLAKNWRNKTIVPMANARIRKAPELLADNFCELQTFQLNGTTYDEQEYETFCGKIKADSSTTFGTITLSFLFNPNRKFQAALSLYDESRDPFWIKLTFPKEYGWGYFHGHVTTGMGMDGSGGQAWTGSITIEQDALPVLLAGKKAEELDDEVGEVPTEVLEGESDEVDGFEEPEA